ncbi:LysE family translocator [Vibrio mangrovi]|uniref:Cysteine/O-acetylserine efflux protein n=1 Tax=Vibrio mangrovi TaxID=474394 RepID=A0A1Y6IW36_9VIBR|nr:LysE family translocator [Vibrio mangrovi]MDW6005070.1 LysE family translocator [Vibrio mangrovi]SMS01838.1 Cysteine/O-acetylserine efflux protein [Vibrio mangrovi]
MLFEQLYALALFAFISTFTPGPNNMMLMASGANVGFVRTLPHMLGVTFGFGAMVFLVGIGVSGIFHAFPLLHPILKWLCLAYLIYLAVKIATSRPNISSDSYQPMTFLSAALFQWVNPKGWSMALTAVSLYNPSASIQGLIWTAMVFIIINIPSGTTWVFAGKQISTLLRKPAHILWFNYTMAFLLVASTLPMML